MLANLVDLLARSPLAASLAIRATLILAAAGLAATALRRRSAAARHLCWCLGLAGVLALPLFSLALPGWSWRILPAAAAAGPARLAPPPSASARPTGMASPALDPFGETDPMEDALRASGASGPAARPARPAPIAPRDSSWRSLAPSCSWPWVAWLAGTLAVLFPPIAGRIALRRRAREAESITDDAWTALLADLSARLGLRRRVLLLRSHRPIMPMTWGWLRPVILLPAEADAWDLDRRRDVLLHELAHIRRLDGPTQTIARLSCALYWFHPLAWYAARRMRIERERACDDVVLFSGSRPSDYAGSLLEIARGPRAPLGALAMARPSQLEGRLRAILDPARPRRGPGRGLAMIGLLAMLVLLVPLSTLQVGARSATPSAPPADAPPPADPAGRMTITGRVLDPSGRPVPDAAVMVIVRSRYSSRPQMEQSVAGALAAHEGRSDGSGGFRIELPRTSSARQYGLTVTAMARGYGIGWADLDPDADPPAADVALRDELVVRGRLFDVKGQPARGVAVQVESLSQVVRGTIELPVYRPDIYEPHRRDLAAWPAPATSDEQGRFALRGLSRELMCRLHGDEPRFAIPFTVIQTADKVNPRQPTVFATIKVDPGPDPKPIAIALQPARSVVGRVTYADTGRPVPHALVASGPSYEQADAEGRFRVTLDSAGGDRFGIRAQSPDGPPYLMAFKRADWPRGAIAPSVDIALPRGVVVRGKITEEGTGRPVAGAVVHVTPYPSAGQPPPSVSVPGVTGPDGSYRVAAPPGPGYLVVQGPDDDYVLREFGGEGAMYVARTGRRRFYAHAYRAVDLKAGGPELVVDLSLRRGVAVRGRALGPDGQPVRDAWVCSRLMLRTQPDGGWKLFIIPQDHSRSPMRDGRFVLHGLDPGGAVEVPAYFLDPERRLGAVARFTGRSGTAGPVTVRLEPCGTARLRLVTPDGKPLDHHDARTLPTMVVTPGPPAARRAAEDGPLFSEEASVVQLDPVNYSNDFRSDADGRLTLPALIPGATYRIQDLTPVFGGGEPAIRKEFTVKPGETIDLGDILIAKPQVRN